MVLPLALTLLGLLVGAAGLLAWRAADGIATRLLVPTPYGLQPEFALVAFERHASDAARGNVVLPLPRAAPAPQFARVDAKGCYGLLWDDDGAIGHGLLGPPSANADATVRRPLRVVQGSAPRAGAAARLDASVFRRDPLRDHGLAFEDVRVAGPVGSLAAWWLDRASESAVVMVHGRRRGDRSEALRALPTVAAHDVSVLVSSYRNHDSSDPSPDGLFHYGTSEADDLNAALAWLRARGVRRVVLVTYSMGAAVALVARERWPDAGPELLGLTMDAPLVDPRAVVAAAARAAGLPRFAVDVGLGLAARRSGVDFARLDLRRLAASLDVPLLLHATARDGTIPVALVDDFAARVPSHLLTYRRLDAGDHVEAWNVDPEGYRAALAGFLARALAT